WRKIISTESVERLSAEEADIVFRNNAHDAKTAERHYRLLQKEKVAIRGADILNRLADPTYSADSHRTPNATAIATPVSASSSSSSSTFAAAAASPAATHPTVAASRTAAP